MESKGQVSSGKKRQSRWVSTPQPQTPQLNPEEKTFTLRVVPQKFLGRKDSVEKKLSA
jgi:hypothetical protein